MLAMLHNYAIIIYEALAMKQSTISRVDTVVRVLSVFSNKDGLRSGAMENDMVLREDMAQSRQILYGLVNAMDIEQTGSNNGAVFCTTFLGKGKLGTLIASLRRIQKNHDGNND